MGLKDIAKISTRIFVACSMSNSRLSWIVLFIPLVTGYVSLLSSINRSGWFNNFCLQNSQHTLYWTGFFILYAFVMWTEQCKDDYAPMFILGIFH